MPRSTSAILPASEPFGSDALSCSGSDLGPQSCWPFEPLSVLTSTTVCGVVAHEAGTPSEFGATGKDCEAGSVGERTVRSWPK